MDQEMAVKNLRKLLNYNFSVILPSHGAPVKKNAKEKLEKLIKETPGA
jgi:hypothetical protein